jgi:hypothetical protein
MGLDFVLGLGVSRLTRRGGSTTSVVPPLTVDGNVDGIADSWTLTVGTPANTPITPTVSGSGQLLTLATSTGAGSVSLATVITASNMSSRQFKIGVFASQTGSYATFAMRVDYLTASDILIFSSTSPNFTATGTVSAFSYQPGFKSPFGTAKARFALLCNVSGAGVAGGLRFITASMAWQ